MSPASQGALEVERYIGSCLISSNVRSAVGAKTSVSGITKKQQEAVLSRGKQQQQTQQQREYPQQGNYSSGNEQCQFGTWAGAPLISMTSSPRRHNQRSSPPPSQNNQQHQQQQQQQQISQQQQQQGQQVQSHLQNRSPLSRLAIHTQGAPLILAGRFHNRGKIQSCAGMNGSSINGPGANIINANVNGNASNFCNGNNVNIGPNTGTGNSMITSVGRCLPARGQRLTDPVRKPQQQQQSQQMNSKLDCTNGKVDNSGTNVASIDSLSIASDESSGSNNSENSLPRIIKPRKRRKKDRKPASGGAVVPEMQPKPDDQQQQQQQQHQQNQHHSNGSGISEQSSIVTLKPYVPVCYETRYEPHRGHRRPPPIGRESYPRGQTQSTCCTGSMQQQQQHQQQEIVDTRQQQQQQQRYAQRHVQVKVLDDNRNVVVPTSSSMPGRSMLPTSKGITTTNNNNNYHHRNHHHHVAHHHHHHHHHHNDNRNGNNSNNPAAIVPNGTGIVHPLSRHRYLQHHPQNNSHQQHQSQHDYDSMPMGCEDGTGLVDGPQGSGGCQCRYCDPSGLIWDVDQSVYSPFLTPPHASEFPGTPDYGVSQQQFAQLPLFLSRTAAGITCPEQAIAAANGCDYYELNESGTAVQQRGQHHHVSRIQDPRCGESVTNTNAVNNACNVQASAAGTMLRRSWSDPTSYFSEEISAPNRDVGVIGDRGQTEVTRGRSSWPGSAASGQTSGSGAGNSPYGNLGNLPVSSQGLEVSTEIVTSPNGHRDLEIKFYSSSPSAIPAEDDKSAFLDDGEDFSDIWSYHESKLQQDFRTLLQAEE